MQHYCPYIFCLFIMGALGLYIGHASRQEEVSFLKELVLYVWHEQEKQIVALNVVPIVPASFESHQEPQVSTQADTVDYMKQIAHVQVPQEAPESGVSKSSCAAAQAKDLELACTVLKAINHVEKVTRIQARLDLAEMSIAGPLSKYVQNLSEALLVRFCDDNGKLVHTDYDAYVQADVLDAVALLEQEMQDSGVYWEHIARVDFTPLQRRVQRHAYNGQLKKSLMA